MVVELEGIVAVRATCVVARSVVGGKVTRRGCGCQDGCTGVAVIHKNNQARGGYESNASAKKQLIRAS